MKIRELLAEGLNHPIICVDVQPEYANYGDNAQICENIVKWVAERSGPVLMYINGEETGVSGDTKQDVVGYWNSIMTPESEYNDEEDDYVDHDSPIDWNRFKIVDKGFGWLRSWMDNNVPPNVIIKVIREMYQQKVTDSRQLFGGDESTDYNEKMDELTGLNGSFDYSDPLHVDWVSIGQLRQFGGAYLVGGGRNECLREVELIMNAFNIRYKRVDQLVY